MSNNQDFENDLSGLPEQDVSLTVTPAPEPEAAHPEPESAPGGAAEQGPSEQRKKVHRGPPPRPKRQEAQRRIGTLTMGFALIVTGVIALIAMFYPNFDMMVVFRLSPVLFIFLGLEVLISYLFHKGERLRYDFLSGFVCFVLICAGACLAFAPTVWMYAGPPAMTARNNLEQLAEDRIYDALKDTQQVESMSVYVNFPEFGIYSDEKSVEEFTSTTPLHISFDLSGPFRNQKEFAQSCRNILDRIQGLPLQLKSVHFNYDRENVNMNLQISDRFQFAMDANRLSNLVIVEKFSETDSITYERDFALDQVEDDTGTTEYSVTIS